MPPSSATMRGIAGPTIVWLIDATSMPSMSAMKMLRVERSSPGAFVAVVEPAGAVAVSVATPWVFCGMPSTVRRLCSHCKIAVHAVIVTPWGHEHGPADRRVVRPEGAQEARDAPRHQPRRPRARRGEGLRRGHHRGD